MKTKNLYEKSLFKKAPHLDPGNLGEDSPGSMEANRARNRVWGALGLNSGQGQVCF